MNGNYSRCAAGEHVWTRTHGTASSHHCERCGLIREQTAEGVSYATPLPPGLVEREHADARAHLWARAYGTGLDVALAKYQREGWEPDEEGMRINARRFADAAVRDFDEHYLGGKR